MTTDRKNPFLSLWQNTNSHNTGLLPKTFTSRKTDYSWKYFLYSLPKGVMSFVLRSFIDCLPPLLLLNGWKTYDDTMHSLQQPWDPTLHTYSCSVFLNQGRYTWQHNSILQHLVLALGSAYSSLNSAPQIYADLPGYLSSTDSTIPSHTLPSSQRPDLVLLFPNKKIYIIGLTIPFESNLDNAHTKKTWPLCLPHLRLTFSLLLR